MAKKNWGSGARRQRLGTGEYFGTKKTFATEAVRIRTGVDPVKTKMVPKKFDAIGGNSRIAPFPSGKTPGQKAQGHLAGLFPEEEIRRS